VKRLALWLGTAAIAAASAGVASAQGVLDPLGARGAPASITLWSEPGYRGEARTIYGSEAELGRLDFNDRTRSVQANGPMLLCEDNEFRGRCERVNGSVPDLSYLGLAGRLSSVTVEDGRPGYGGGYGDDRPGGGYGGYPGGGYTSGGYPPRGYAGGGYDDDRYGGGFGAARRDGIDGRTVTFFVRPNIDGRPLAARGQGSADQFCRAAGYRGAVYYSQGERVRQAIDTDGRLASAPVLQDVLCRR
jgi:hypothetical protein